MERGEKIEVPERAVITVISTLFVVDIPGYS
jgi:hypothetical protein